MDIFLPLLAFALLALILLTFIGGTLAENRRRKQGRGNWPERE